MTDDLPAGITIEQDGDLYWVVLYGRRLRTTFSRREAEYQAKLATAFIDIAGKLYGHDLATKPAPFSGYSQLSPKPTPVSPRFGFYFDWTYRLPTWRVLVRADYASWLIWKTLKDTSIEDFVRQTEPTLLYCYHWIAERSAVYRLSSGVYKKADNPMFESIMRQNGRPLDMTEMYFRIADFWRARRALKKLIRARLP